MTFAKYHSIDNIVKVHELFNTECIISEKIHGTNCRIAKINSKLLLGSRSMTIYDGEVYYAQHDGYKFVEFVDKKWGLENLKNKLPENHIFVGEFFGSGVQKEIKYFPNDAPEKNYLVFDVITSTESNPKYLSFQEKQELLTDLNIFEMVPVLFTGNISTELLNKILLEPSVVAKNVISIKEGIVITPLMECKNRRGNRVIAKYKTKEFDEKTPIIKSDPKPLSMYYELGQSHCTYARVVNSIDKLRQTNDEKLTLRVIPQLISLVYEDILKDSEDDHESLSDEQCMKEFQRGAASMVATFFKEWLNKIS